MKIILTLIVLLIILNGCFQTTKPTKVVYKVKYKQIVIPHSLTEPVIPNRPITSEEFLTLNHPVRQVYLTNYTIDLLKDVNTCNIQLEGIRKLNIPSETIN